MKKKSCNYDMIMDNSNRFMKSEPRPNLGDLGVEYHVMSMYSSSHTHLSYSTD